MSSTERYVLIGLGGVGGVVLRMLVAFLHHRGKPASVYAVDGDHFEERNRGRQLFGRLGPKAQVLCEELAPVYGDGVTLIPVPHYITSQRARHLIADADVVFCTPDNHATRKLVESRCRRLQQVALFSGGNDGVSDGNPGTYGNVQVYLRADGKDLTNRLSRFHPEIAKPTDRLPTEQGCSELAASAPQLLFTNLAVASHLLGSYYAWLRNELAYEEVYFDVISGRSVPVHRT